MSASLVGSEMCIRDRKKGRCTRLHAPPTAHSETASRASQSHPPHPSSYALARPQSPRSQGAALPTRRFLPTQA
eukprot:14579144-Alexandrium_andersonii.AAC.1